MHDEVYKSQLNLISELRYCWQDGDLKRGKKLIQSGDDTKFEKYNYGLYLNEKIRVLRDIGEIEETYTLLATIKDLLEEYRNVDFNNVLFNRVLSKYLYNRSINYSIKGELEKSITSTNKSLKERIDNYSAPYLLLRLCKCYLYLNDEFNFKAYIDKADRCKLDKWAIGLRLNTESEFYFIVKVDITRSLALSNKAYIAEKESLSKVKYSVFFLINIYISLGNLTEIERLLPIVSECEIINAKIAYDFGVLASSTIKNDRLDFTQLNSLIEKYTQYLIFLFPAVFSILMLCKKLKIAISEDWVHLDIFYNSSIDKQLINKLLNRESNEAAKDFQSSDNDIYTNVVGNFSTLESVKILFLPSSPPNLPELDLTKRIWTDL